jgi:hypothetical protein
MRQKQRWLKLIRGQADIKDILNTIREKMTKVVVNKVYTVLELLNVTSRPGDNLNRDVKLICDEGRKLSFVFSTQDPGYEILMFNARSAVKRCSKKNLVDIQFIEDADHTFTTRSHRVELINKITNHLAGKYR